MKLPIQLLLSTLLLFVAGCQPNEMTNSGSPNEQQSGSDEATTKQVSVTVASWQEVQQKIEGQQGKIVVVDLWSSWCVPCIREFPNLVKLHQDHPQTVACMSVNLNYDGSADLPPESHLQSVREFLTKQNATFDNVVCSDSDTDVYSEIDLASIPAIYVYDKAGKLRKRFDNDLAEYGDEGFTYEKHVIPLVDELLAE